MAIQPQGILGEPETFEDEIHINLGIDFGTSFTKVCYRDLDAEESIVANIGKDSSVLSSVIAVDSDGRLHMDDDLDGAEHVCRVEYLKMRLADVSFDSRPPLIDGFDLGSQLGLRALSAWFLASVVRKSQTWIRNNDVERLRNRVPVWSANIGIPVEQIDSELRPIFSEVIRVAWLWTNSDSHPPAKVTRLRDAYCETCDGFNEGGDTNPDTIDCHAVPEIKAAIYPFAMSRDAAPGVYAHFDVGGGSLDGVSFKFQGSAKKIICFAGKVGKLGIAVASERLGLASDAFENPLSFDDRIECLAHDDLKEAEKLKREINKLVGPVVADARKKTREVFNQQASDPRPSVQKHLIHPDDKLRMFLGGGGSLSKWYRRSIEATHERNKQQNAGIPPYDLQLLTPPADLRGVPHGEEPFRHAISYGLSIPEGEGPGIVFPSEVGEPPPLPKHKPHHGVAYENSKDAFD